MRRRSFITILGGAAVAWPMAARAQQVARVRRVGELVAGGEDLPSAQAYVAVVRETLQKLGWIEGRNIRIDYRFATAPDSFRSAAAELVELGPDVLIAHGSASVAGAATGDAHHPNHIW